MYICFSSLGDKTAGGTGVLSLSRVTSLDHANAKPPFDEVDDTLVELAALLSSQLQKGVAFG